MNLQTVSPQSKSGDWNAIHAKALLLFIFAFALYFFTRSPALDEWDSVQFALGTREFNLWKHQPHPPGYPLYIFLGWSGTRLWGWDPEFALHLLSCLGGALFVTAWFLIIRLQFGESFAWLIAGSLAATPVVWMTSTQVLSDMPAAGLLAAELLYAMLYTKNGGMRDLIAAALLGAATTGARPQLILVVAVILLTPVLHRRAPVQIWLAAIGTLLIASLLWLLPTCYLASKVTPTLPAWQAYPAQLYDQWKWRFDKPHIFIGASDFSAKYFGLRFGEHILGWFGVGMGFLRSTFATALGFALVITGLTLYLRHLGNEDRAFWKAHRAWGALHILIIFCCLPANQRYYLMIFPLLLIAIQRGLLHLREPWRPAFFLPPVLLLSISIPLAIESHREESPPMKLVHYLQQQYSSSERKDVILFVRESRRHLEWYAPEFPRFQSSIFPPSKVDPQTLAHAKAIYTDSADVTMPPGWTLVPVVEFHRSFLIELKQRNIALYWLQRPPTL